MKYIFFIVLGLSACNSNYPTANIWSLNRGYLTAVSETNNLTNKILVFTDTSSVFKIKNWDPFKMEFYNGTKIIREFSYVIDYKKSEIQKKTDWVYYILTDLNNNKLYSIRIRNLTNDFRTKESSNLIEGSYNEKVDTLTIKYSTKDFF